MGEECTEMLQVGIKPTSPANLKEILTPLINFELLILALLHPDQFPILKAKIKFPQCFIIMPQRYAAEWSRGKTQSW
jgi:hypothetical protein